MKAIAMIPARYAASRFPAKLLQDLGGKPVIQRTYEATIASGLFSEVYVVTDHQTIFDLIQKMGGTPMMSQGEFECGSDRIAAAAAGIRADIIVNVQGDEPFVQREPLEKVLACFEDTTVRVASLMQVLTNQASIEDPNYVKVAVDKNWNALFFSRSVIPYPRSTDIAITYYEHVGVYAFKKQALIDFTNWPMSPLEAAEKIECLRYLENGVSIKMAVTNYMGVEIDTPEDLIKAAQLLK